MRRQWHGRQRADAAVRRAMVAASCGPVSTRRGTRRVALASAARQAVRWRLLRRFAMPRMTTSPIWRRAIPSWLLVAIAASIAAVGCGGARHEAVAADSYAARSTANKAIAEAEVAQTSFASSPPASPIAPQRASSGSSNGTTEGSAGNLGPEGAPGSAARQDLSSERRPLLIYTASLVMAVFETTKAIDAVEQLAKQQGGYLIRRVDSGITIRVPAAAFDASLARLKELGDELHREVTVQDVTVEFNDLTLQLRNLEVMRERFEQLLKRASSVKEALAVEKELQRVLASIEKLKGRLKLMSELIAYSTITVRFESRPVDRVRSRVELPFPWLQQLGLPELLDL